MQTLGEQTNDKTGVETGSKTKQVQIANQEQGPWRTEKKRIM